MPGAEVSGWRLVGPLRPCEVLGRTFLSPIGSVVLSVLTEITMVGFWKTSKSCPSPRIRPYGSDRLSVDGRASIALAAAIVCRAPARTLEVRFHSARRWLAARR